MGKTGNNRPSRQIEAVPPLDEEWWAALLAEEEKHTYPAAHKARPESMEERVKEQIQPSGIKQTGVEWDHVRKLYELDEMVLLTVTGYNRGGLLVEGGELHGFVPISHLVELSCGVEEEERDSVLERYIGRSLYLKVIECDPSRGRVVFSERAALAKSGRRNQLMNELRPGSKVCGVVTNITDFGIFVDLGGVEGLIHVSEISWGRVNHPGDAVQVGDEVQAYVINIDQDRSRIALSLKRLYANPWETAEKRYHPGQLVDAVITSVVPYGAFACLEEGLDGLIHSTEMKLEDQLTAQTDLLAEGQHVQVKILHIDANRQRLGMGLNSIYE